ncbi:unnamed protein product [Thelazia callipaeda]|uniref:Protein MAK10 homolog n=1 Tax=Thelazia callipaeda TaxID=103827 RepID=A0A0N5CXP5_THECL|nr:unnamed protein product [Thelazia callipaeda]
MNGRYTYVCILNSVNEGGEVSSEELVGIYSSNMTLVSKGNDEGDSHPSQKVVTTSVDITDEFFKACKKLSIGELVMAEDFKLSEAMSAIELMDPKMDVGMRPFDPSITFENLLASNRLNVTNMDEQELIATMDALLASLISWLEGNSIAQTLLTCVFLNHMDQVKDIVLSAFSYSILHLAAVFRHIIQMASVYEEEDFNGYAMQLQLLTLPKLMSSLKAAEFDLQKRIKQKPENQELLDAILYRLQFVRLTLHSLSTLVQFPAVQYHASDSSRPTSHNCFRPNLEECAVHMNLVCLLLDKLESTVSLGLQPLGKDDDDYAWLPAFEPDINRRQLPPTFPRKTKMRSRVKSVELFKKLCSKILSIATVLPIKVSNVEDIIDYLRLFSLEDSCVLSRSLLQMVLFPNDDNLFGYVQFSAIIIDSIRMFSSPSFLDPSSQMFNVEHCRECWEEFVTDSVKAFLEVIQMFGLNLSRQREKILFCIEDFSTLQAEAERTENALELCGFRQDSSENLSLSSFVTLHLLSLIKYHFYLSFYLNLFVSFEYPYVYWCLSEVIFKWLVNMLDRSINLVAAGEKRISKLRKKAERKKVSKCKKEIEMKRKASESQRCRLFYRAQAKVAEAFFMVAVALITMNKIRVPLTNMERFRFEHRMLPFATLNSVTFGIALFVEYAQYIHSSRIETLRSLGGAKCFALAADAFDWARGELESLNGNDQIAKEAAGIARICRNNAVVSRIISSGSKNESQVNFVVSSDMLCMYPLLKIV